MASELRVDKINPVDGVSSDSGNNRYGGGIIQVVQSYGNGAETQTSSTSYVATGTADGSRTQNSIWHINFEGTGYGNSLGDKNITFLDSPASTSALTYKLQVKVQSGATSYVNRSGNDANADYAPRTSSSITVMEVSA